MNIFSKFIKAFSIPILTAASLTPSEHLFFKRKTAALIFVSKPPLGLRYLALGVTMPPPQQRFFIYRCDGKLNVLFYQNNFFPFKISMPSSLATLVCLNGFIFSTTPSRLKREPVFFSQNVTSDFTHCSRILSTQS